MGFGKSLPSIGPCFRAGRRPWRKPLKRKTGSAGEEVDSSVEPKSLRSTSMCPIRSSAMSTDVSTMTRISDRLYVGNKFLGRLLEHTAPSWPHKATNSARGTPANSAAMPPEIRPHSNIWSAAMSWISLAISAGRFPRADGNSEGPSIFKAAMASISGGGE